MTQKSLNQTSSFQNDIDRLVDAKSQKNYKSFDDMIVHLKKHISRVARENSETNLNKILTNQLVKLQSQTIATCITDICDIAKITDSDGLNSQIYILKIQILKL